MADSESSRPPLNRRRDKPQLSCNLCKKRKLKCNRQYPCNSCSSRGLSSSCTYASYSAQSTGQYSTKDQSHGSSPVFSVQDRINKLENLVLTLMKNTTAQNTEQELQPLVETSRVSRTPDAATRINMSEISSIEDAASPSALGHIKVSTSGTSYVSSTHWAAVLDGIADLKDCFEVEDELPQPEFASPLLLYGNPKIVSKSEILASIPPRPVVDRLVSCYFNTLDMAPTVLHSGQFRQEYEQFWENPADAPIMWVALLFTMMCLATEFNGCSIDRNQTPHICLSGSDSDSNRQTTVFLFREKAVQCLFLGNYTKAGPPVLEALILYFTIEHFLSKDAEIGLWILLGMTIHLAMRMGYHRDPHHFSGISPATGEMRRRIWTTLSQLDLIISAQMGLPRNIREWQADTVEPRNLHDSDFDDQTKELPPSRPETEITPMLHIIARNRIMPIAGIVLDLTTGTRPYSYAEVISVEKRLEDAHFAIPPSLKWQSMPQSFMDSPQIIMQRISLELSFHKWRIVLHQKYLFLSREAHHYAHSRQVCTEAAIKILEYQDILHEETQPGGQLYYIRWKLSSLVSHDFLLATSIICFCLQHRYGATDISNSGKNIEKIIQILEKSHNIWSLTSASSKESQKAVEALAMVLRKLDPAKEPSMLPFEYSQTSEPVPGHCYSPILYQGESFLCDVLSDLAL